MKKSWFPDFHIAMKQTSGWNFTHNHTDFIQLFSTSILNIMEKFVISEY